MKWLLETYGLVAKGVATALGIALFVAFFFAPVALTIEVSPWWLLLYLLYPVPLRLLVEWVADL